MIQLLILVVGLYNTIFKFAAVPILILAHNYDDSITVTLYVFNIFIENYRLMITHWIFNGLADT